MNLNALSTSLGLFFGTFVSEDASCISGGILASQGKLTFTLAAFACGLGIFVSDLAIIAAGRAAAKGVQSRWLNWFTPSPARLARAQSWFNRHGGWVVLASRFIPGTRSATCFAAGLLNVPMRKFGAVFLTASMVWTPVAVGAAYYTGQSAVRLSAGIRSTDALLAALALGLAFALAKFVVRLSRWRERRLLLSRWRRLTRWEFWPAWAVYPPVVAYIIAQSLKRRSLTLFTNVNPGIGAGGGLRGESKSEILRNLSRTKGVVADWILLAPAEPSARLDEVRSFMARADLTFPIVLKPDVGDRGSGVVIAKCEADVISALHGEPGPLILQAYIPGVEFGVFYHRAPSAACGQILAITDKRMLSVTGDGIRSLETLLLADDRAVCMAAHFLEKFASRLGDIPSAGETVTLTELGTHCRGALFLDGSHLLTPALLDAVDNVSRSFDGFYFGRYDIRAESLEAFQAGHFKVIELNGLTSEATSIYDPRHSVFFGWRLLCRQWRIALEIADENRGRGFEPLRVYEILSLLFPKTFSRNSRMNTPRSFLHPAECAGAVAPTIV